MERVVRPPPRFGAVRVPLGHVHAPFTSAGVAFAPHETSAIGDHFHSEGVEGYGLKFQGDFDYSFQSSYSGFDFCTWNTMEDSFYLHQGLEPPSMPDPSRA